MKKLTKNQIHTHRDILIKALLLVIRGVRSGSIKAKPIIIMETGSIESLDDMLWAELGKCGISERKEAK